MENRLLLIDGSSMLVTNYYGNLPKSILFEKDPEKKKLHYAEILHSSDGTYTNAIYGMLRTVLKIIEDQKPSHIAVAFDKSRDTFRRKKYADYKGNRGDTPEPLKDQFVLMEELLKDIGITVLYSDDYEADDLVGTLVHRFRGQLPICVMTKDHDYLQLVSNEYNVRAWMVQTKQQSCDDMFERYLSVYGISQKDVKLPDKVFEFTDDIVFSEEGVWPGQIADLKGLVGDSSDNIPGVSGISSAAAPLLAEYGTVEGIYKAIDENDSHLEDYWSKQLGVRKGNYKKLTAENARETALLSKELATIVDVPEEELGSAAQLESLKTNINKEELRKYCKKLEFKTLLEKIEK